MNATVRTTRIGSIAVTICFIAALASVNVAAAWGQTSVPPSIRFLSPTSFGGEIPTLTDEDTGANSSFRLSAWTGAAPAGSLVEFELVPGDLLTKPITIGAGVPVLTDTYEYQWDIAEGPAGVIEGLHTLKATLYDETGEELSTDRVQVSIVHGSAPEAEGDPSIDLTYPVSGGPLGQFFAKEGANSVFASKKGGGAAVRAFFTTARPGSPPVWKVCNPSESDTNFGDGVRCTYPADDPSTKDLDEAVDPSTVTAVALRLSTEGGSADVARVVPYRQEIRGLNVTLHGQTATGTIDVPVVGSATKQKDPNTGFPCSDWMRIRLTDQVGYTIAGANLDAHAQGPTDQLKFHTSYLAALNSPHTVPPNEGHSFPEPGARCVSTHDTIGMQGEHGLGGQPDRKHVETAVGTRDSGTFDMRLQTDQAGATRITIWAEKKDDDTFCSDERESSTSMTLIWGGGEAPPQEEAVECALPDPDAAPAPIDGSRTVRMETGSTAVKKGKEVSIVGAIVAADELCQVAQSLKLKAKRPDAQRFRTVASGISDSMGLHSFQMTVQRTKIYRVVAPTAGDCALAKSQQRRIRAI